MCWFTFKNCKKRNLWNKENVVYSTHVNMESSSLRQVFGNIENFVFTVITKNKSNYIFSFFRRGTSFDPLFFDSNSSWVEMFNMSQQRGKTSLKLFNYDTKMSFLSSNPTFKVTSYRLWIKLKHRKALGIISYPEKFSQKS